MLHPIRRGNPLHCLYSIWGCAGAKHARGLQPGDAPAPRPPAAQPGGRAGGLVRSRAGGWCTARGRPPWRELRAPSAPGYARLARQAFQHGAKVWSLPPFILSMHACLYHLSRPPHWRQPWRRSGLCPLCLGFSYDCALRVAGPSQGALVELLGQRVTAGLACMVGPSWPQREHAQWPALPGGF
jgi:hypothetical protein